MGNGEIHWNKEFIAFRILGNLYFVGTDGASIHFLDTGDGLWMFDTGFRQQYDKITEKMQLLGLKPENITEIFLTHGHIDHIGGAKGFREVSGANIFLGAPDWDIATGKLDQSWAKESDMDFDFGFTPDVAVFDGDIVTRGNASVQAVASPGHTAGTMSYFFNVTDGEKTYIAGLHGGTGLNTLSKAALERYNVPYSRRDDYFATCDRLAKMHVDIYLGNHMSSNHTREKYARLLQGDTMAFVNPNDWAEDIQKARNGLKNLIKREENH